MHPSAVNEESVTAADRFSKVDKRGSGHVNLEEPEATAKPVTAPASANSIAACCENLDQLVRRPDRLMRRPTAAPRISRRPGAADATRPNPLNPLVMLVVGISVLWNLPTAAAHQPPSPDAKTRTGPK